MKKNKKQFCPNCGKEMVLAESHERECDESAMEYNYQCTSCGYQVNVIEPTEEEKKEAFKDFWNNETQTSILPYTFQGYSDSSHNKK